MTELRKTVATWIVGKLAIPLLKIAHLIDPENIQLNFRVNGEET